MPECKLAVQEYLNCVVGDEEQDQGSPDISGLRKALGKHTFGSLWKRLETTKNKSLVVYNDICNVFALPEMVTDYSHKKGMTLTDQMINKLSRQVDLRIWGLLMNRQYMDINPDILKIEGARYINDDPSVISSKVIQKWNRDRSAGDCLVEIARRAFANGDLSEKDLRSITRIIT